MGSSLQDQLLKAGLVSGQKAREARTEKRRNRGSSRGGGVAEKARREAARKQQEEKAQRDRVLNSRHVEAARRKAIAAEVRQLIEANRVPRERGEFSYHFTDGDRVKTLSLTEELRTRVVAGKLVVVRYKGGHELVLPEVAEKIRERDSAAVIGAPPEHSGEGEDPYYAKFEIPDDLVW